MMQRAPYDSPLWILRCSFRWCLYLKALPHSVHLNLRLPAPWVSIWCCERRKNGRHFCLGGTKEIAQESFSRPLFQTGQGVWVHAYLSAQTFRVAIKVVMLVIKWELFSFKKVLPMHVWHSLHNYACNLFSRAFLWPLGWECMIVEMKLFSVQLLACCCCLVVVIVFWGTISLCKSSPVYPGIHYEKQRQRGNRGWLWAT